MAQQLVYTSAPKLLDAGRSGFGVIARSRSLPPLAANAIERFSKFENLRGTNRARVIMAHRKVMIGSARLHVLSRIKDSGSDHTGRTNHIAHHLIFAQMEVRELERNGVTPADVFAQYQWLDAWQGAPRTFESSDDVPPRTFQPNFGQHGGRTWEAVTGDGRRSRLIAWEETPRTGAWIVPDQANLLGLIGEALAECEHAWGPTFTTFLEGTDELSELDWIVLRASESAVLGRVSSRKVFDLTKPETLPVPSPKRVAQPAQTVEVEPAYQHPVQAVEAQAPAHSTVAQPSHDRTVERAQDAAKHRAPSRASRPKPSRAGRLWLYVAVPLGAMLVVLGIGALFVGGRGGGGGGEGGSAAQPQKDSGEETDNKQDLVDSLIRAGEGRGEAQEIAGLDFDGDGLNDLSTQIGTTISEFQKLSDLWKGEVKVGDLRNACKNLAKNNGLVPHLEKILPESSLSMKLASAVSAFKVVQKRHGSEVKRGEDPLELIEEFRSAIEEVSPERISEAQVEDLLKIFWSIELERLTRGLGAKSIPEDIGDVSRFIESREKFGLSDDDVREIYPMMGDTNTARRLKRFVEERGQPVLVQKWLLENPKDDVVIAREDGSEANDQSESPGPKLPITKEKPLRSEEWCVMDPFQAGKLSLGIPYSESDLFKAMKERSSKQEIEWSLDGEYWKTLNSSFGIGTLLLDENGLSSEDKATQLLDRQFIKLRLQGSQESVLTIFFSKWPKIPPLPKQVEGRLETDSSQLGTYRMLIEGEFIHALERLAEHTVGGVSTKWIVVGDGWVSEGKVLENGNVDFRDIPSGEGFVSPPGDKVVNFLRSVADSIREQSELKLKEEQKKELEKLIRSFERKHEKKPGKDELGGLKNKAEKKMPEISSLGRAELKKIWHDFGYLAIKSNAEAVDWLKERLVVLDKGWSLNDPIALLSGEDEGLESELWEILKDPKGVDSKPEDLRLIFRIMNGDHPVHEGLADIKVASK
ncbi:hypothetical protein [Haloferula sp. A504]|uniref:GAP1-N2 domain-containing protein n=1 Tax=Haloferula sp. A504 TaxID=3373601 RepID=UPI0031C6BD45|nr:hypothetical protein [Verrucomicrobiaceae bacterium E54]